MREEWGEFFCASAREEGKRAERRVSTGSFIYSCDCPWLSFLPGRGHIQYMHTLNTK